MKKALSLFLSIVLVLGIFMSVPFTGLPFNITAEAASVSDLTFELNDDGVSYSVTACDEDASCALAIPGTYNGKPVTSIDDYAFYWCESLTSITIPDSVTSIGDSAFEFCESLTTITIPDSVTSIGDDAFYNCTSLESVVIGNGVTSIGDYAFDWCTSLTSITIPDSVTSIGEDAFYYTAYYNDSSNWENGVLYIGNHLIAAKTSISGSYDIKAGTKTIANEAFSWCESLTSITIPDSVTSIGWGTFEHCTSITSITIPDSVTSIGWGTFEHCTSITSITIPDSVTSIGDYAFWECNSLTSITIPDSVTSIGEDAFHYTAYYNDSSNWENGVLYIGNHLIVAKTSISGSYEIKAGTKTIADDAFEYCDSLTSITIPDSVTSIGFEAFYWCRSLTSITIPDSVTSIGNSAFSRCDSLTSITIPDSVTSIGNSAFYWCTSLTAINVSSSNQYYTSVDGVLFNKDKTELIQYPAGKTDTSYTIPDSVTSIGNSAFGYCTSLTSITIPNSVTSIGGYAFRSCTSLTSITIPDSVTSIGEWAFYGCSSLTSITIPDSVTSIGDDAFGSCTSLKSATIGNSVTSIGSYAFSSCDSLTSITIPDSVTSIGYGAFRWCDSLTDVYYSGSSDDWSNISIESYNYALLDATIHFNSVYCSHTSTKWVTDKAATVNAAGSQHKECTACGEVLETAVIPQLKPSNPTLSKAANANGGVTVTWKAVSGADSYRVYRKTSSTSWTCLNSKVTSTSYTDKSAKSGTTYYYTVRAENEAGLSGYNSTGVSVKYLAMPTVTIANASTGVKVSWNKISGASKYYVYRKASGDKSWTQLTNSATGTSYTDTKAKSGTTYYYTVKAVSGSVASEYKSSSALKYLAQPKVSSLSNTNSGITVKWNKITGASGYYVYRKTGSGSWSLIYTVKSGSTVSYTDKSAKAGTTYYYTVRAYSGSVKSTYTSSSAVRRLTTPTLKSVSSAKSGITFKWNKVTGASGYYVYRKTGSGGWKKIDTVKSGSTVSYLDKTAKKGTTYTYTVRAYYSSSISYFNTTGLKIKDKY